MALALAKAAPLKLEVKLLQALKEFNGILADDEKYEETSPPEPRHVMLLTCEINRIVSNSFQSRILRRMDDRFRRGSHYG